MQHAMPVCNSIHVMEQPAHSIGAFSGRQHVRWQQAAQESFFACNVSPSSPYSIAFSTARVSVAVVVRNVRAGPGLRESRDRRTSVTTGRTWPDASAAVSRPYIILVHLARSPAHAMRRIISVERILNTILIRNGEGKPFITVFCRSATINNTLPPSNQIKEK
jgi:hypothetical protein